ncbi:MAG: TonB-dependent receptor plug domain-containing protein [Lacunisphaera sp.]|nr:TonB-dependent receptor plug domain-containing protein [Lacunisphaera sp.]
MKTQRTKPRSPWLLAALALLALPALEAQTTTAPANPAPATVSPDDEVIVLSPFEVNPSDDKGYAAGGTLSGTRLRTDLRDVAASTSIVTKQFMEDVGATNLAELLVYTNGTEVSGLGGNMSAFDVGSTNIDVEQVNRQPGSIVRIRGIGTGTTGSDQARDFFTTDIPSDSYNVDRVEINRGPNAMLFGLGSPSGIVNAQLIRAKMNRNATSVEAKYGRFGTYRGTLDHNQVLIKDKLAFRFATLKGEQKYMQDPASDLNERFYGTLTFKPFKNTTLRVSGESAHRYANKPQNWLPTDQISAWFQMGKPTYDPTTQRLTFLGTPPPILLANGAVNPLYPGNLTTVSGVPNTWNGGKGSLLGGFTDSIYIINENPNVRSLGITGDGKERGVIGYEFTNDRVHLNVLTTPNATNPLVNDGMASMPNARTYLQRQMTGVTGAPNSTNWTPQTMLWNFIKTPRTMTDTSIYDYYTQLVEGPNKFENTRWKTFNVTLEQRLGAHAGVEFSVDKQGLDSAINNPTNQSIQIDINTKLPDGTTNPNFGRPYVVSVGWAETQIRDREGARVTAYYELDLRKNSRDWLGKLLGKHIVTGNITSSDYFYESFGGRPNYSGADYLDSEQAANAGTTTVISRNFSGDKRAYWMMNYMGPSLANATDARNGGIQSTRVVTSIFNVPSVLTRYYQSPVTGSQAPAQWQDKAFTALNDTSMWTTRDGNGQYTMSRKKSESLSKVIILNSRLLADNLITTLGWRKDKFEAFDSGAPNRTPDNFALVDDLNWPLKQTISTEVSTFNYGLVAHAPKFITDRLPAGMTFSLTYNKSDNKSPASPVVGVDGKPIEAPTGSTKEFGGRVGFFDGKFELRVVNYETKAANATNPNLRGPQNNIQRHVNQTYLNIAQSFNNRIYSDPQPQDTSAPKTAGAIAAQKAWNDFWATPYGKNFLDTFLYKDVGLPTQTKDDRVDSVVSTSDIVSKGWDYELIYTPTRNWRISANAAKSSAVRSNTGAALNEFADKIDVLMQGPAGDLPQSNNSTTAIRDGFAQEIVDIQKEILLDGSPSPEERKWRFNVVTNYTFSEGRLKNLRIGGAVRWQDKIAIGYPVINVPKGVVTYNPLPDVKHPYYGSAETNYDAWIGYSRKLNTGKLKHGLNWSVQLNVRNIGVDRKLIPVAAQPDGSIAAYRTAEPMTWVISNKFDF